MITQEDLKKLLHYDPDTGFFTWVKTRGGFARVGQIAGSIESAALAGKQAEVELGFHANHGSERPS